MAFTKIIYGQNETELVMPNVFPIYQQTAEATGNVKRKIGAVTGRVGKLEQPDI